MAVVVDEFGAARGIIMLEDILEVIVGELEDEFDAPGRSGVRIRKLGERDFLVSAQIRLEDLKREVGIDLPSGSCGTLAGFLMNIGKAIPLPGTVIRYRDLAFTVERGTLQAAQGVRIRW